MKLLKPWELRRCSCSVWYFRLCVHSLSLRLWLLVRVAIRTEPRQRWNLNCVLFVQCLRRPNVLHFNLLSQVLLSWARGSYICLTPDYWYGYGLVCCWHIDESAPFLFLLLLEEFIHVLLCFFARCNNLLHVIIQSIGAIRPIGFPRWSSILGVRSADTMLALACWEEHLVSKFRPFDLVELTLDELLLVVHPILFALILSSTTSVI